MSTPTLTAPDHQNPYTATPAREIEMTSTLHDTEACRLGPYIDRPTWPVSRNLAETEILHYQPGSWTPRPDGGDPDLHCPTVEDVDLAETVRHTAEIVPDAPLVLAEVLRPYSGEVLPQLPRGRRRGRGRARGVPDWLLIVLCLLSGAAGGSVVLTVAVIQAVTR